MNIEETTHINKIKNIKLYLFLCVVLFFPSKDELYKVYTLILFVLPFLLFFSIKIKIIPLAQKVIFWLLFFLFSTSLKVFLLPPPFDMVREYTEFARILVLLPVLLINEKYFNRKSLIICIKILFVYIILDSIVTLNEISFIPFGQQILSIAKQVYHSRTQLGLNFLAKGLNSHGAEHGMMMNFLLVILLMLLKHGKKYKYFYFLCLLLCILNLIASGSKTSMLSFGFVLILFYFILAIKEHMKIPFSYVLILGILIFGTIWAFNSGEFIRLELLFKQGTSGSSYVAREDNWNFFLDIMDKYKLLFPIGWGKSIFMIEGKDTFFTDNEYFTFIIIHGILVVAVILKIMFSYLWNCFKDWSKINAIRKTLFFMLLVFLFMGTASISFSSPKLLVLLCVVYKFSLNINSSGEKHDSFSSSKFVLTEKSNLL